MIYLIYAMFWIKLATDHSKYIKREKLKKALKYELS